MLLLNSPTVSTLFGIKTLTDTGRRPTDSLWKGWHVHVTLSRPTVLRDHVPGRATHPEREGVLDPH